MEDGPHPVDDKQRKEDRAGIRHAFGWGALAVLIVAMTVSFLMGWDRYLSLSTIGLNYEALRQFIDANLALSLGIYMTIYIVVVALSLPGGLVMTLSGGLLFGWLIGTVATTISATAGATLVFLVARSSIGEVQATRARPMLHQLRREFGENALSYILFLRLVPVFPFVVVNIAPALIGIPLRTYIIGTFVGIIPATLAFSVTGAGLGGGVEAQNALYKACLARVDRGAEGPCAYHLDVEAFVTTELLAAFVLLGLVALIPVAVKKWRKRNATA